MPLTIQQERISYEAAAQIVAAGIAKAETLSMRVSVCVTDFAGGIIAAGRMDGAHAGTINAARGKAHYSARSARTTKDFVESRLMNDDVLWRAMSPNQDVFLVPGGCPLMLGDACIGGVGVSGGKYQDDVEVAEAAASHMSVLAAGS